MSVSERLRELKVGDGLTPYLLEDILPEIVAVVENAERIFGYIEDEQLSGPTVVRLRVALAALDHALK